MRKVINKLVIGDRIETVLIDRLKPHLGLEHVEAASPPQRGRPGRPVQWPLLRIQSPRPLLGRAHVETRNPRDICT